MKKIIAVIAASVMLAGCSTTDLDRGVIARVVPNLTDISVTHRQAGCEFSFIAVKSGNVVQGCLHRPMIVGPLAVRWMQ